MEDRETPRMRKYGESKTTRIMMATVPHVTSGSGLRKFQADGFLFDRIHIKCKEMNCQAHKQFLFLQRFSAFYSMFPTWSSSENTTVYEISERNVSIYSIRKRNKNSFLYKM